MKEHYRIIEIDPVNPGDEAVSEAAEIIRQGGTVVFPTFCLYGIGADALNPDAVEKVFTIKRRPESNPVLILVPDRSWVYRLAKSVPETAEIIMDRFWPGRLTIVFEARDIIPEKLKSGTGKIGIRVPDHPVAAAAVKALGSPVTGTSANISGRPGCSDIVLLDKEVREGVDAVLDAGQLKGGKGSTVIDVTCRPPVIVREGEVKRSSLSDVL